MAHRAAHRADNRLCGDLHLCGEGADRWDSAVSVLFQRANVLAILSGLCNAHEQHVHKQRGFVQQGLFSPPDRANLSDVFQSLRLWAELDFLYRGLLDLRVSRNACRFKLENHRPSCSHFSDSGFKSGAWLSHFGSYNTVAGSGHGYATSASALDVCELCCLPFFSDSGGQALDVYLESSYPNYRRLSICRIGTRHGRSLADFTGGRRECGSPSGGPSGLSPRGKGLSGFRLERSRLMTTNPTRAPIAVSIEGISKKYRLGVINRQMLSHEIQSLWARWRGKEDPHSNVLEEDRDTLQQPRDFWALKDISFTVAKGEAIAIMGKNGSGKSTLLKILSRITAPTEGRAVLHGRLASLLEVGTGFNGELTGKENVYLSGAIMGLTQKEITERYASIIEFSEVEQFIETPIKRYSSGMRVRLAFSVAAHLYPEILILDEVLAVGDASFREKCLIKMDEIRQSGVTILFVSHNSEQILDLCSRGVILHKGTKAFEGPVKEAVSLYTESLHLRGLHNPAFTPPPEGKL